MQRVYFDHNATTPVAPEALEAMLPALREGWGNPSSVHQAGQAARHLLDEARQRVARFLGTNPDEIVFTSGGTESDQLAVFGSARLDPDRGHVITTAVEHPAVLAAAQELDHTIVGVDANGLVDPDAIRRAIRPDTALISVMHANNELGTLQPIAEVAKIAAEAGVVFHSDGVQAAGKLEVEVKRIPVDLYSISGHKIGAPKGIGVLYQRKGVGLRPLQVGGKQERARRGGTENVPGAVAMGAAADWMRVHGAEEARRLEALRNELEQAVQERIAGVRVNGAGAPRVANTTNLRFDGIDSDALLIALDLKGFAVSSGAACSSGSPEPSHVLLATGLRRDQARASIRISLGRSSTRDQVEMFITALADSVAHLRKLAPAYA